jgi:isoquinoline 1-oxidoreductase beta subunit
MLGKIDPRYFRRPALNRRGFLKVVGLSGAGFMIGCSREEPEAESTVAAGAASPAASPATQHSFGPFVRVGSDNTVTVIVKHLDKGQGVTTGLSTIVAEELDADWAQMRSEFAPANASLYNNLDFGPVQGTGGSSSIHNSWMQLREAAAGARAMLVGAAAAMWGVADDEIIVAGGELRHEASGRTASFGELAARAADVEPPAQVSLKDPADFTLIGKDHLPRLDSVTKTDGTAIYTLDVDRPGMLTAVVAHPPKFGAAVAAFDASAAKDVPGVTDVVQIPRGVAVVAENFWSAKKGRDALDVEWDYSQAEVRGSDQLFADYAALTDQEGIDARADGDAETVLAGSGEVVRSEFRFPFLAHATMEPMDCVVELGEGSCELWTGSQLQTGDQAVVAGLLGIDPADVKINTLWAGGSFGRRAVPDSDYVAEAVMIAQATGGSAPVKLVWTREDDMSGGRYRPMSYHVLEAALDDAGNIAAWRHRVAIQSFLQGTSLEGLVQDGLDTTAVEGARGLPYAIPNVHVTFHEAKNGVPTLWWRSVGHTHNGYATEVFFDELAQRAGRDPFELRRELLQDHPRHLAVLELAAEKAGWGEDPGPGRGRGIAVHESFSSFVAEVVDVSVADDGSFSIDRVVCAVDCGLAINPDVIRAQMEGGIGYALSAALREQVTLAEGEVVERNFDTYQALRIDEMPEIEVHIVPSTEAPTGVGEPGVPPLAPALSNALFAATGKRVYTLPIGNQLQA